ncbi:phage tail assembly chaperone [Novosphingobium soli]|uniref:Phage tail assembly chaperone n=1 Tax=Novosphingobium soli TaxID=574956 RepID=A0ABV6CRZ1_9SPHN
MNARFDGAALALWALAARTLGWRPAEFWAATPAEFAASLGLARLDAPAPGLDRQTLQRLMDNDHGR